MTILPLNTTFTRTPVRVHVATEVHDGYAIQVYRTPSGRYTTKRHRDTALPIELGITLRTQAQAIEQTRRMIDLWTGRRQAFEDAGLDRLLGDIAAD